MLTLAERRRGIGAGLTVLIAVILFVGTAVVTLLAWDGDQSASRLFTAYTWSILRFTLLQAALSTLLSILFAIPVALALARRPGFPGRVWIVRLMALPMGLPALVGALGLLGVWGRQGVLNGWLTAAGLEQPVSVYGLSGILLAHTFFNIPLAVRLLLAVLERLPAEYWLLSASLGMKPFSIFRFVEWPALARVVPGVAGLIFMLCATSFTLVLVLGGGPAATTLEVAIYQALRFDFDPPRAIALAFLQITVTAAVVGLVTLLPAATDMVRTAGRSIQRLDGRSGPSRLWDFFVIAAAVIFVASPLLSVLAAGLRADLWKLVTGPRFIQAATTSLAIAVTAGTIAVTASLAILNARQAIRDRRDPNLAERLLSTSLAGTSSLVLVIPPIILGTGWFLVLRQFGNVGDFAPYLVAIINALMALPFAVRVLEPALEDHRRQTARLAAALGIGGIDKWRLVDIPVLLRPILTALSFAMALSLGDLGAVALFGSSDLVTLPWLVYSSLSSYRTNDADGLALILGVVCLFLTILGTAGRKEHNNV
ncbi:thiamine/thiamine pyrophosphate ABC transporter permease ThiP [Aliirhizobium smilacinae]|uniref:Thiamine transport system permease protein ThiP n=1 Tax=Aliirhizobium smilacinae TaxID=1395944 RepID=A0A5C4XBX7_9HYPH|nr:thiamine/thiamine pyrophosphate ABC transporter permease ThiP [Rhizobium smilacinae]TNM60917.1 thiamine/thiamine pyrophosphate ABC transporter permease ThiP [Rhizobium smilacinae]